MPAWTEHAATLTNNAVAIAADVGRRGVFVSNNSDTVMTLRLGGQAASAAIGISIPAGTSIQLLGGDQAEQALSLFCAGTAKAYTIYEW